MTRLRWFWAGLAVVAACTAGLSARPAAPAAPASCVVTAFENRSGNPSLDWIGESFRIAFSEALRGSPAAVLDRQEWERALQLGGVPEGESVSHATLIRLAESADARWLVLGWYDYDGETLRAEASLLDLQREHLIPLTPVAGPLDQLESLQARLGQSLRQELGGGVAPAPATPLPLPAYENYVRALLASSPADRLEDLKIAAHLAPGDGRIALLLGQTYLQAGDNPANDASALQCLSAVPATSPDYLQAQFFAGVAAYRGADYARAAAYFTKVKETLPLPAVVADLALAQSQLAAGANAAAGSPAAPPPPLQTDFPADGFRQLEGVVAQFDAAKASALPPGQQIAFELREGERLSAQGGYDAAIKDFQAALALLGPAPAPPSPQAAEAHVGLARIWLARHDAAQAGAEVRAALAADPGNAQAASLARQLGSTRGGGGSHE